MLSDIFVILNYLPMQKNKECLIIDDDLDDQEIFLMCMNKIHKNVHCTAMSSGIDAVALLMSNSGYVPDYIFLDVNMPQMNGIECLMILKSIPALKNSKILMYSTTSAASVVAESKKLGADDFIVKPSKTTELVEKLAIIFDMVSVVNE